MVTVVESSDSLVGRAVRIHRRMGLLFAALALVVGLSSAPTAPANAAIPAGPPTGSTVPLTVADNPNKCMDNALDNVRVVQIWDCNFRSHQIWFVWRTSNGGYQFENTHNSRCLIETSEAAISVNPGGCDPNAAKEIWDDINTFFPQQGRVFRNRATGHCLFFRSTANRTRVEASSCAIAPSEEWFF